MQSASGVFGSNLNYLCDILAIEIRNLEAIGLAQQKMLEGVGLLAQRQAEMAEGTFRRSFGGQASASGITAATIGQIASLKTTILEGRTNLNILSELAARSSGEVANILQSRMIAALDELEAALEQALPQKPTPAAPPALTVQPATGA